ncbi:hypothetical protein ACFORL_01850 [Legionella dresdenensis]|uniref:Ankyrin repeat protein n=1 Tax=Legionella dresdenensis TaxID=450200 RepID=A0ABV8CBY8_9GAMM
MKYNNYSAVCWVAQTGNIAILQHLEKALAADQKKSALNVNNYMPFVLAAENDHMDVIKFFENWLKDEDEEIRMALKRYEYNVFRKLSHTDKLDFVKHFESYLTDEDKKELARASNYYVLRQTKLKNQPEMHEHFKAHLRVEDLLSQVKTICDNEAYWKDKDCDNAVALPETIKAVQAIIKEKDADPEACIIAIQQYCQKQHDQHSRMSPRMFSGHQKFTNEFCSLLAEIDIQDLKPSADKISQQLDRKFSEAIKYQTHTM